MKAVAIFNPAAGRGTRPERLARLLRGAVPGVELLASEAAGAATCLASRAVASGASLLIVAGGDGLANEVVNGVAPHFAGVRLGLLPLGTGNDLARSLGVPRRGERAAATLASSTTRRVDVVRVSTPGESVRYGLNVGLMGFGAEIRLSPRRKRRWGALAYLRDALGALPGLRARRFVLQTGEATPLSLDAYLVAVANGRFMGGGVPIAPDARPDDGLLDIVAVPHMGAVRLARVAARILSGRAGADARLMQRRAADVRIEAEPGACLNLDGEVLPRSAARFEVLPGALEVLVPGSARDSGRR